MYNVRTWSRSAVINPQACMHGPHVMYLHTQSLRESQSRVNHLIMIMLCYNVARHRHPDELHLVFPVASVLGADGLQAPFSQFANGHAGHSASDSCSFGDALAKEDLGVAGQAFGGTNVVLATPHHTIFVPNNIAFAALLKELGTNLSGSGCITSRFTTMHVLEACSSWRCCSLSALHILSA